MKDYIISGWQVAVIMQRGEKVFSLDGALQVLQATARQSYIYGVLYIVTYDDGSTEEVTSDKKFLVRRP